MDDLPISLPVSYQPPFYSQDVSQMYENILHQPLRIPGGRTVAACDLLQALLHKDQRQRLGSKTDFVGALPAGRWALSLLQRQPRSSHASSCSLEPGTANSQLLLFTSFNLTLLVNQYLWSTYYVLGFELNARDLLDWVSALKFMRERQTNKHKLLQSVTMLRPYGNSGKALLGLVRQDEEAEISNRCPCWLSEEGRLIHYTG